MDPNTQQNVGQDIGGVPVEPASGGSQNNGSSKKGLYIGLAVLAVIVVAVVVFVLTAGNNTQNSVREESIPESVDATLDTVASPQELAAQARNYIETSDSLQSDGSLEEIEVGDDGAPTDEATIEEAERARVEGHDQAVERGEVEPDDYPTYRYSGSNRFATAANVSRKSFPEYEKVDKVVIVNGESEIDMAIASGFAGPNTTVLLVKQNEVPVETEAELQRVAQANPKPTMIVIGGEAAISRNTEIRAVDFLSSNQEDIVRISGANRYATAAAASKEIYQNRTQEVAYLAAADAYADIMLANNAAEYPVLLVDKERAPLETSAELCRLGVKSIIVVGGENAVNVAALDEVREHYTRTNDCAATPTFYRYKDLTQVAGPSRLETAVAVSRRNFANYKGSAIVVNGYSAADMLSASVLSQSIGGAPMLLVNDTSYSPATVRELKRLLAVQLFVIGGEQSVNEQNLENLRCAQFNCTP